MDQHQRHEAWMHHALAVGRASSHLARPNPAVGAVILRDGHVIATGATQRPSGPHAEVEALERAGAEAVGATLVVTLEPCVHHGRTPPCTQAILAAGISRVVIGLRDPNPLAAGGASQLREHGVEVVTDVLARRVAWDLRGHVTAVTRRRPWTLLKLAQTADGATVGSTPGDPWITGPAARAAVHELRADSDAVLVGSGTVLADDPRLTVRDAPAPGGQPRAVVWDRRGRISPDAAVVRPGSVVVTTATAPRQWRHDLRDHGVAVVEIDPPVPATGPGTPSDSHPGEAPGHSTGMEAGMAALVDLDVRIVLAEPGTTLARALLAADLVDEVQLHVAHRSVNDPAPTPAVALPDGWTPTDVHQLGDDVAWRFRRRRDQSVARQTPGGP